MGNKKNGTQYSKQTSHIQALLDDKNNNNSTKQYASTSTFVKTHNNINYLLIFFSFHLSRFFLFGKLLLLVHSANIISFLLAFFFLFLLAVCVLCRGVLLRSIKPFDRGVAAAAWRLNPSSEKNQIAVQPVFIEQSARIDWKFISCKQDKKKFLFLYFFFELERTLRRSLLNGEENV